jgi:hypothetical protein
MRRVLENRYVARLGIAALLVVFCSGSVWAASAKEKEEAKSKSKPAAAAKSTSKPAAKSAKKPAAKAAAKSNDADAAKKFETFCGSWLNKLRERERFNKTKIAWQKQPSGVVGEYVGYDTETYRMVPPADVKAVPVGRLVYMEIRFRVAGESEAVALQQKPEIIERTEVTELFRYDRGNWVY